VNSAEHLGDAGREARDRRSRPLVHAATGDHDRPPVQPAPGFGAEGLAPAVMDALELELRQLDGVGYVSFPERTARTVIGLGVHPSLALGQVQLHPVVRRSGMRVRLLLSLRQNGDDRVELHLAQGERRVVVEAEATDSVAVASQVLRALKDLGYSSPFVVDAVHDLSPELGSGSLVVLRHPLTGQRRRGLANGATSAEAHARAVLNALNRYLQPSGQDD
jgi:hypothetical protein